MFLKVLIVAGGLLSSTVIIHHKLEMFKYDDYEYIIAVDSGYNNCEKLELKPDFLIGDLDSITTLDEHECEVIKLKPNKNHADLKYAVDHAVQMGAKSIVFLCATGRRMDHFLNNIDIMNYVYEKNIKCVLIDEFNVVTPLIGKKRFKNLSRYVSVLPITKEVVCTATYMKYPMEHYTIKQGDIVSISNEATFSRYTMDIEEGFALIIQSDY